MVTRVLAIVGVICGLAGAVSAQPVTVVIVETRDAPVLPTLASQLEVHASGRATIETRAQRDADPMTFVGRATAMVAGGEAAIVVWIAPVEHGYLVFAAGPWPERALIELARVDETIEPAELERTIALKVAGLLDTLLAQPEVIAPSPATAATAAPVADRGRPGGRARGARSGLRRSRRIRGGARLAREDARADAVARGLLAAERHDRR